MKLKQKWLATKSKSGALKPTEQLTEEYERRESHLHQRVHILEQQFSSYEAKSDEEDQNVRTTCIYSYNKKMVFMCSKLHSISAFCLTCSIIVCAFFCYACVLLTCRCVI